MFLINNEFFRAIVEQVFECFHVRTFIMFVQGHLSNNLWGRHRESTIVYGADVKI